MMNRCTDKAVKSAGFIFFILSLISCVSAGRFEGLDKSFAAGHYAEARSGLEADKNRLYTGSDAVLYYLDAGMLSRFAGDYEASNKELAEAEKLIEFYYAKSISQSVGSFMLNDTVIDYAGEDYEDIYTNLFMALNYIHLDKIEDAFVEIRRFDNKIKLLSSKYAHEIYEASKQNSDALSSHTQPDLQFHNSALARYVSLLLYRSEGKFDSAAIDKKFIQSAFAAQPSLYPFPLPAAVDEEFLIPNGMARLNVFCFTGSAPEKREEVVRVPDPAGGAFFKLALPVMYKRSSKTAYVVEIEAEAEDGTKSCNKLEPIESIENIAEDTFRQKQALLYTKAVLRAVSKTAASSTVSTVLEGQDDEGLSLLASLLRIASGVFIEVSEKADTRISRFFPAEVRVGGLNLKSGLYRVRVSCYDKNGKILHTEIKENVRVQAGKLNIMESICIP